MLNDRFHAVWLGVLAVVFSCSCRKSAGPTGPPMVGEGYFPSTIGIYWVYEVFDSVAMRRYDRVVRIADTVHRETVPVYVWTLCDSMRCDTTFIRIERDTVWKYSFYSEPPRYSREVYYVLPLVVGATWPVSFGRDSVVSLETISVRDQVYRAYQVYGVRRRFNVYESEHRWFVPYLGMVKRQYRCQGFCDNNEVWELKDYGIPER
jgi:hypothetical protein